MVKNYESWHDGHHEQNLLGLLAFLLRLEETTNNWFIECEYYQSIALDLVKI